MMARRASPLLTLMIVAALSACGTSPPTQFFSLEPVPPAHAPSASSDGPAITVYAVHLPAVLDRLSMVRGVGGNQVDLAEEDHWAAPLDAMTRRVLAQDLALRLPPDQVIEPGMPQAAQTHTGVTVAVQEFWPQTSGHIVLDAQWSLMSGTPPAARLRRQERITVPAGTGGPKAQARAMSEAVGQLADRIVEVVASESRR